MNSKKCILLILLFAAFTGLNSVLAQSHRFEASFESLENASPAPEWFKDAKFGIYFHWGVYSVPAFANEWYPRNIYLKGSAENIHHVKTYGQPVDWPYSNFITGAKDKQGRYVQFSPKLKSQGGNFDPDEWAQLFADAGAKFAGPVAEHHDGFSMWASKVNPWNAKDLGPQLDLVGLLTDAIRKKDMKIILSMHHAYNITGFYDAVPPVNDPKLKILYGQQGKENNEMLWLNKHKEIIDQYKPDIIWQDFNLHMISQPVLLKFLSYYYNKADEWNKEVVATYKDGLNTNCALLDYERGGPVGITEYYWLTDDAISSSSWCYTDGIGYYSAKQVMHGFIDRISKNGNLLLNISPMADGTIPAEQKAMLLTMGAWLKKYGEAVYATRAWQVYGEGPTRMGGAHGSMGAPLEGTAKDIRYTRSKDSSTLYAILLGWDDDQNQIKLSSLSRQRINLENLESVALINGESGKYLPLAYQQNSEGLIINLPDKSFEELAYVIKLSFNGKMQPLDMHAEINTNPRYFLVPGNNTGDLILGSELSLSGKRNDKANQWKLEKKGDGLYIFHIFENPTKVLACSNGIPVIEDYNDKDNQHWSIENSYLGLFKISNQGYPSQVLSITQKINEGAVPELVKAGDKTFGWNLQEVCELPQEAFKQHLIPGVIEAEEFDKGCPQAAYYDSDENNSGGAFRQNEPVDIEKCSAGGFNVGWTKNDEWMAYTVNINKTAAYNVIFYVASNLDNTSILLKCDDKYISGILTIPNTGAYQNWKTITKTIQLDSGIHILKLVIKNAGLNIDKMIFEEYLVQQPAPVKVNEGLLQGTYENGLTVYKGIPFAAPPTSDLRWRAPRPPYKWDGVKQATKFAPAPMQGGNPPSGKSEDCLYLNIWTPAKSPKEKLPVLVWIYGGGFSFGSNSEPVCSGEKLAQKGVILVSIAYRVGPLAFLAHPELSAENPNHVSGNYGLLDQIAGLQWIQKNIAAFGGDPGKVTIFGESAGGISVSMLCASPLAKGLFRGAISQSGGSFGPTRPTTYPGENMKTLKQAESEGQNFLKKAGVSSIAELRKLDAEKLPGGFGMGNAWPIVDGYVIPDDQYLLYQAGKYNDVPVLIGYNSDEGASFSREKKPEDFIAGVKARYGKFSDELLRAYPVGTDIVPKTARDLARDAAFGWHTWSWARLQSQTGKSKVFYYYFDQHPDYPEGSPRYGFGSPHAQDVAYVFQHLDASNPEITKTDLLISDAMATYWTNFAKYGDPNGQDLPVWPSFSEDKPAVMYFGPTPHTGLVPDEKSLKVLNSYFEWRRSPEGEAWAQ
jgi:carboxylesterase type B/alpha-L-fucosidase